MLLANMSVAHKIYKGFPYEALLRRHADPKVKMMEDTIELLAKNGINLDDTNAGTLEASIQNYTGEDKYTNARLQVIVSMVARPMVVRTNSKYRKFQIAFFDKFH